MLKDMVPRIEVLRLFMQSLAGYLLCRCWHHSYVRGRSGGETSQLLSQYNAEIYCVLVFYFVAFIFKCWLAFGLKTYNFTMSLEYFLSLIEWWSTFLHLLLFWSPLRRTSQVTKKWTNNSGWSFPCQFICFYIFLQAHMNWFSYEDDSVPSP